MKGRLECRNQIHGPEQDLGGHPGQKSLGMHALIVDGPTAELGWWAVIFANVGLVWKMLSYK
jgi:hypothetical protein